MADDAPNLLPQDEPAPPRTDLWIAIVFFVFGVAAGRLAHSMPTYADQHGEIYTAPGLVPGFYAVVIVLLSVWLGIRAIHRGALRRPAEAAPGGTLRAAVDLRLGVAAALCLVFVVGLLGRMPFWLAAAIFVATFIITFEWQPDQPVRRQVRRTAEAILLGVATGVAVTLVFERLFYVRLP
jgi:putative tricarboxylic transport membrane protein